MFSILIKAKSSYLDNCSKGRIRFERYGIFGEKAFCHSFGSQALQTVDMLEKQRLTFGYLS